jgi:hypothetical protein
MVRESDSKLHVRDVRSAAQVDRDQALIRVSRTRRLVLGAATALTAGIAALVSAVAPGKTSASTAGHSVRSAAPGFRASAASSNRMPPLATPTELGLGAGEAPKAAPSPSSGSGGSSSGSSQSQAAAPQAQSVAPPAQSVAPPVQQQPVQPQPAPSAPVVSGGS